MGRGGGTVLRGVNADDDKEGSVAAVYDLVVWQSGEGGKGGVGGGGEVEKRRESGMKRVRVRVHLDTTKRSTGPRPVQGNAAQYQPHFCTCKRIFSV